MLSYHVFSPHTGRLHGRLGVSLLPGHTFLEGVAVARERYHLFLVALQQQARVLSNWPELSDLYKVFWFDFSVHTKIIPLSCKVNTDFSIIISASYSTHVIVAEFIPLTVGKWLYLYRPRM